MSKKKRGKVAVILPVYNSASHLATLAAELLKHVEKSQIIAVDDGSLDNSAAICRQQDFELVGFSQNRGKGAALLAGMKRAAELGFEYAITLDSDEQHPPHHIPEFIRQQIQEGSELVLGYRNFSTKFMPWQRICSNRLTSWLVSITIGEKIKDSQCGYRMYCLKPALAMEYSGERYQFETEILLKLSSAGVRISQVPVDTVYGKETSYISHWRDIYNFVKVVVHHWFLRNQ